MLFARRLSIFYLFVAIFSVFFGFFYYRYIPANQSELNSRGFRILNQLASNMVDKDNNLRDAFNNVRYGKDGDSTVLTQIDAYVPFVRINARTPADQLDSLDRRGYGLFYRFEPRTKDPQAAVVRIGDFLEPVLASRDDLFDNYVLLMKDTAIERWREMNHRVPDSIARMIVIYQQKTISSSPLFSLDSVLSLQKNTDLAVISTVTIGGRPYNVFFQPFDFTRSRVVLCGLVDKARYDRQVRSLPTNFIVAMILVILLGLMALPFVKVFLISAREPVQRGDVLRIVLALYLGAAVLVLAGAYFLSYYSAERVVDERLGTLSGELGRDIDKDLRDAGRQLDAYTYTYRNLRDSAVWLSRNDLNRFHQHYVDSVFTPREYPLIARLTWFDDSGKTVLKWNPYRFFSPYASEKEYPFFDVLKRKAPNDYGTVLDAGRSNVTGEFQMLLARRCDQPVITANANGFLTMQKSFGIVLSFYLHAGLRPLLPRGYGFCLVKSKTMQVLMHSDPRRNLAENLYQETGENERLKYCIDQRLRTSVPNVEYYGSSHTMYVTPVTGQDVSLVVFYDDTTHSENILRMLHFGGESLLYISLIFLACLFLSTRKTHKPSKLSFGIDPVEWVRPSLRNWRSYHFTRRYFCWLIVGTVLLFYWISELNLDIRIAFYLSVLLPFYALWGFVASRKKEDPRFAEDPPLFHTAQCFQDVPDLPVEAERPNPQKPGDLTFLKGLFTSSGLIVIVIVLLNVLFLRLMDLPVMDHGMQVGWFVFGYQALLSAGMIVCYYQNFLWRKKEEKRRAGYAQSYICSLYFSVLVMSLIPAIGLLWYGWSVEKIQFVRSDQLDIAGQNVEHMKYVATHVLADMDSTVLSGLEGSDSAYSQKLLYRSSRYLPTEHIRYSSYSARGWTEIIPRGSHDPDQPYINFLDELFLLTSGEYNSYAVPAKATDSSWIFRSFLPDSISLFRQARYDLAMGVGSSGDPLIRNFTVDSPLDRSLFTLWSGFSLHSLIVVLIVFAFLWMLPRLLALAANRIFLLDFIRRPTPAGYDIIGNYYPGGWTVPDFLETAGQRAAQPDQEEYILETMLSNRTRFQQIWDELPREERYFLYDFADDGYTNYKDADLLFTLLRKGLLRHDANKDQWFIFAISFREFVLRKKGSPEIDRLKERYAVPGVWATIRIPTLIVIAACAVLLIMTQESVSHQITVAITSIGAIVPIILEVTKRFATKGAG